ncbi:MAG: glutathione S-transferase family protein [Pseudomonadota bacterium]
MSEVIQDGFARTSDDASASFDLYTAPTPNGWKVSTVLEELELTYALHALDFAKGEHVTPERIAMNPNGKIPVLFDRDTQRATFESNAVLLSLARKEGKLIPNEPIAVSEVEQWLFFQAAHLGPMMGQAFVFTTYFPEKIPSVIGRYQREVERLFGVINSRLSVSEFLAGPEYTIADIACIGWMHVHALLDLSLSDWPHIDAWYQQLMTRPAVKRGLATPLPLAEKDRIEKAKSIVN